ncbi:WD40 repeat-like protein [Teratosphaeria nubilosa]|uniref:WD40 repeat-like protein n=1 Tax=Teratosphaeria nubilosa TaxID=161662 RepID=A0A6G1L2S2_9PEZI|nr:WD40 repeat-like protein [Teratosphaeria nubilosa]
MDGELEKDETEIELERLVFGDSAGFREGLRVAEKEDEVDVDEDGDTGFEGLDDAALFFTDTGADDAAYAAPTAAGAEDEDDTLRSRHPAAWEDSDDERTLVSLASAPRLRKLRVTEAEDVVNGKEYAKRLRRQFELLNPRPEWAQHALQQPARKKRRLSDDAALGDDEGVDEMDLEDDDVPSAAPLSKLLQNAESLVRTSGPGAGKKRKLRPEVIDIQRTKNIAGVQPSAITSLSFHPTLPLMLSSGPSSTLYLHQIAPSPPAPSPNPLLTSMHIRGAALTTTAFHPSDSRIFLSARRRYFHVWNLQTGRVEKVARVYGQQHEQRSMERFKLSPDGQYMALLGSARKGGGVINILSASTLQWFTQVRIDSRGGIAEFAWWSNSKGLTIAGKNGEVTEWSVLSQEVVARWQDEGAVGTTTIALGGHHEFVKSSIGTDRWVVTGSSSGIVNIYDRRSWLADAGANKNHTQPVPAAPKPTRSLDHLTTPTSHIAFSPDGQVLAIASKWKRDALKLVHLPSCTIFKNWPTSSTPLGRITGVAFCDGGIVAGGAKEASQDVQSLLAVANEQGKIRSWEIR